MERWGEVDRYIVDLFGLHDEALDEAVAASRAAGLPQIHVSAVQGKLLHVLARAVGARRILEVGTLAGFSGIWLARALPADGRLVTLELDPRHARVAQANFERAGLADRIEIMVGPAIESLATLATLADAGADPFDMVFIDADKESYADYLDGALRLARPGALIVADNVVRQGRLADPADTDPRVVGVRRFAERLATDPRVSGTIAQMVGDKSYDGLAFAVVLETD
jgi:predicted O-methyltransferase YrrM